MLCKVIRCRFGILGLDRGGWSLSCGYQLMCEWHNDGWGCIWQQLRIRKGTQLVVMSLRDSQFSQHKGDNLTRMQDVFQPIPARPLQLAMWLIAFLCSSCNSSTWFLGWSTPVLSPSNSGNSGPQTPQVHPIWYYPTCRLLYLGWRIATFRPTRPPSIIHPWMHISSKPIMLKVNHPHTYTTSFPDPTQLAVRKSRISDRKLGWSNANTHAVSYQSKGFRRHSRITRKSRKIKVEKNVFFLIHGISDASIFLHCYCNKVGLYWNSALQTTVWFPWQHVYTSIRGSTPV